MMNAMLGSSSVPNNLWGEANLTTCFIHNKTTHRGNVKTPYELWKIYQSNLKYLKVWGPS